MAEFSSRMGRSISEPPPPASRPTFKKMGKRDSISELNLLPKKRHSISNTPNSRAPPSRLRKKNNQLFGESFDPRQAQESPKKVVPKSEASREILAHSLLSHFLFSRLGDDELITLVDAMEKKELNEGDAVISQGDFGDYFYVVESGSFQIIVDDVHVGDVDGVGGTFGELALMHNSPRVATVKATTKALLWGLDRATFRYVLAHTSSSKFDDVKEFLGKVKILEGLQPSQMSTLAQAVDVKKYSKDEIIVSKGEEGNEMFVIKEGSVVCRVVKGAGDAESAHQASRVSSIKVQNINLESGDYFGERALMYNEARAADVIATSDCTCYTISAAVFNMVLGSLKDLLENNLRSTLLKSLDVFSDLSEDKFDSLAKALVPMEFEEDDEVICEGYKSDHFFLIRSGNATLEGDNGVDIILGPGECFGEEALLGHETFGMTVSAVNDLECLVLLSTSLGDLGIELTTATLTRLRVASESRLNGSRDSRKSFGTKDLASMLDSANIEDDEVNSDGAGTRLTVNALVELTTGRTLGTGSFGRVKFARHNATDTVVALKILQKEAIRQTRQQRNIMNEKELTASLIHPFILNLYGTFQDRDCLYMMLEIVMGGELFRLLHGDGSLQNLLSPNDTAFYAACVASVYDYIHPTGIIYRDLKPENILIANDGYLKIVDWGFAKKVVDKTFTTCGTPEYLAPELVQGTGHGKGVDYWALGILIFEMLTGSTPFVGNDPDDTMAICRNIMNENIIYPEDFDENAADLIDGLCSREILTRLGCRKLGCKGVLNHPFFDGICWKSLSKKSIDAPWKPDLKDGTDCTYFDDIYDEEEEYIEEYTDDQEVFVGF